MAKKSKSWLLAALLIALGGAVYLNWQFSPVEEYTDDVSSEQSISDQSELGQVQYVAAEPQDAQDAQGAQGVENADSVETAKPAAEFENMRAEREKTRNEALATLQEIIDDASLGSSEKTAAVNTVALICERMEQEVSIETLVCGKGFSDCVVVISETQVNVLVPAASGTLTSSDAALIKDIVIGQINISPSSIKIIEVK